MPAAGLLLLLFLALFLRQMEPDWTYSVQYSYAWIVLPCALYLGWLRWKDRPTPNSSPAPRFFLLAIFFALAFSLAFLRPLQEANPDWRLISWVLGSACCLLILILFTLSGGQAWLRHFAFPCLFPLSAIPWPTWIEQGLIQSLTRLVTAVTVEGLNLIGIPALQHGNLIELSQGWVGVNEACSGVRSFQATLMVTLFLGEMFRFPFHRRLLFIAAGLVLAIVGNILRALFLSWAAADGGSSELETWHDPAGFSILAGVFVVLLIAAFFADSKWPGPVPAPARVPKTSAPLSWPLTLAVLSCFLLSEIGTELWYRRHEHDAGPPETWTLQLPRDNATLVTDSLPEDSHAMLRYDEGYKAAWVDAQGSRWSTIFLHWKPGRNAAQLAQTHAPEVCLSAVGLQFQKDLGFRDFFLHGRSFRFRQLEFIGASGPLYVFYLLREDRQRGLGKLRGSENYSARSRWDAVRAGRRHLGQRLLEIAIAQAPNAETAATKVEEALPGLIQLQDL